MKPKFARSFRTYRVSVPLSDLEDRTEKMEIDRVSFQLYKHLLANPLYWNNWGRYITSWTKSEDEVARSHDRLFYRAILGIDHIHDSEAEERFIRELDKYLQHFPVKFYQLKRLLPLVGLYWKDGTTPDFKKLSRAKCYTAITPPKTSPFLVRILPTRIDIEDPNGETISITHAKWTREYKWLFRELN